MRYFLRRLGFYLFTLWAAITINFFIPRMIPGNAVDSLLAQRRGEVDSQAVQSLNILFGLDKHQSLASQYWHYLVQLSHGDLGISFGNFPEPVTTVLGSALPWTLGLIGTTTILAFLIGTGLGVFAGWKRGTWVDGLLPATSFLSSIPYFWLGLICVAWLASPLGLPTSGGYTVGNVPGWNIAGDILNHMILPALTIIVTSIGGWLLSMRNMMVTVTAEDYITVAHAKGLSGTRVMTKYAARNALLPSVSGFGMALGLVVGGTFLVEQVFSLPGVGLQLINAISGHDYPLIQGVFLVVTVAVLAANFLADLAYMALDPRTRKEG
ncbi:binding-protein-dependent transport systems inner membrane component [Catenulispora acidiphila DSM 44928]|uniref:Binding-protein-dependent transport systems inner membrane component n=1 Tax=Catenulispora acidiphila (strain DSM 44928 / JCM 14897 / NBRC 102108 / NRRL B-24433 / ID139908) TaxID=479433 RepID=C7PXH9_CATAD|nr:ABC transporter permease [Catenulispora acidiphila]ACU71432.1 binding-protein-dependent transport systems inner membrane component [Catenulispora acidiphila DSM 44928]